ncbi:hypothetical protein BAUCODRAFT_356848 [Baudoinia panamericana UAMH 10762]|uniref:Chitin synthase activator n=1 Tax=Baudoinia panamericana (strain UAMH 10762) TaxID=717646 RepID=M2NKJ1_BAUPA|nr:uncharacterized protein BAUCODRAFT_356848 [Baudoinia panamericana UAMH 10762]EMC99954.1 hypothetical protein BAUCODRAFT_356848 [Baudoinia panamericana UAMH 10762]
MATPSRQRPVSATFVPGALDDDYYMPPPIPELVAPNPQRINPEMSNQIQGGMQNLNLRVTSPTSPRSRSYSDLPIPTDTPYLSPFPKPINPPPNVPPSDDEVETTLENARNVVLNSNDPEMQLAWAADALVYVGVCADNEERIAAAKPISARPSTPRIEHGLKVDAMNVVTFLADQHHPKAEFLRGMWLEWGRFGQREDKKEAFRSYSRAADRGYARAEYRIGMLYESYNDPIKALRHYHRGVDAGDAASCYRLGMMTLRGQHGQQLDYAKGLDLIRRSAEAADENAAQGAYVYGMLLAKQLPQIEIPDRILQPDEAQAKLYIEKAAYLKFAKAQLKMGSAYELGSLGCSFDSVLSMHYNALASKQGEAEADMALSKWFLVGSEGLFPKNEELAYTYAERAAASGLGTAEFAMGYFNEIGMFVPVNLDNALQWYHKASKHGNKDASGRIEGLAKKQVLSRKDHENVAISRIKSTHGSQHGPRPERREQQRQNIPSRLAQDTTADEVSDGYRNGGLKPTNGMRLSGSFVQPPLRESSRTPYPLDDRPPTVPPLESRPQSVTPYPMEDGPPMHSLTPRPGPAGGFLNAQSTPQRPANRTDPEIRPSSAFHFRQDPRPGPIQNLNQLPSQTRPPYGGYPSSGTLPSGKPLPPQPQQRYDSHEPYNGPAPAQRPAGHRIASGPPGIHTSAAQQMHPPEPQRPLLQHHQQSAPAAPPQQPAQQKDSKPQQPVGPKLDIGFIAPLEVRAHKYGSQGDITNVTEPSLKPSGSMPNMTQPTRERTPAPSQQQQPKPSSRPSNSRLSLSSSDAPRPPPKESTVAPAAPASKPAPATKPTPVYAHPPAPAKPAGKGPKTFDEMGIQAQKQDSDCVVM